MLIEFSVKNYGPFRDRSVLSMEKDGGSEHPDNAVLCPETGEDVLTSAVVFGLNSSGKSMLFKALGDLLDFIRTVPAPNSGIPWYNPFRLSRESSTAPTEMSVMFSADGVLYEYLLSVDSERVTYESLRSYPRGRITRVFERSDAGCRFTRSQESELRRILGMTASNAPLLTVAAQFNNETCLRVHRYLTGRIRVIGDQPEGDIWDVVSRMSSDPWMKERVVNAMRVADFGISDVVGDAGSGDDDSRRHLEMRHDFPGSDADAESLLFPYGIESRGTLQMLGMMGPVIEALRDGGTVLFDEFGSSLHTVIARWIISQFSAPSNPNGAQIIVNTHDLMLMDTDLLLRRDQIWFTDKDRSTGAASLYPLSDFNGVRKDMDILKSYLSGRFDALPSLDRGDIL